MGHETGGHAGILRYTINTSVDIQVHTCYIPGSMEGHASYMTYIAGAAWRATPVI